MSKCENSELFGKYVLTCYKGKPGPLKQQSLRMFKYSDFDGISSRANELTCLFPTKILKQKVGKVSLLP